MTVNLRHDKADFIKFFLGSVRQLARIKKGRIPKKKKKRQENVSRPGGGIRDAFTGEIMTRGEKN